ncbi:MAG: site-2 protease family protein [Desulfurococcus sp.]|nr:site-2 protease family protein [Desulfurococcus sp.]
MDWMTTVILSVTVFWVVVNLLYRRVLQGRYSGVEVTGYVILNVKKSLKVESRLSKRSSIYNILVILAFAASLVFFYASIIASIASKISTGESGVTLLVPGVNVVGVDILYFIISVGLATSLHEFLHAQLALRNGINIKSYGFILALVIPLAYVEIDEDAFKQAGISRRLGVLSAGIAGNLALALTSLLLLSAITLPVGLMITDVKPGSPADGRLQAYDIIVEVNGTLVKSIKDIPRVEKLAKPTVLYVSVLREGRIVNLSIPIGLNDTRIGVYLAPALRTELIAFLGAPLTEAVYRFLSWNYIVNYSIALVNAAPLFITDGGKFLKEILGDKHKSVADTISLVTLILILLLILHP